MIIFYANYYEDGNIGFVNDVDNIIYSLFITQSVIDEMIEFEVLFSILDVWNNGKIEFYGRAN